MRTRRAKGTEPAQAIERRRELRQQSTMAERLLWGVLRNRRLAGEKFRRQYSIGAFIGDFVCVERKLVIELDGGYHDYTFHRDVRRERFLESAGYTVVRFANEDVVEDVDAVAMAIRRWLIAPRTQD